MSAPQGVRAEVGNIATIEGLRGLAVLWVAAFHYCLVRDLAAHDPWNALIDSIAPLARIVRNGYLGVDLFFLITGFLLTLPWFRHAQQGLAAPSATGFYARRVRRIVPAYYVQLLFLFYVAMPLLHGFDFAALNKDYVLDNLAAHLSFQHYTNPRTSASMGLNGALWTLTLEAQYYLLVPLLAPLFVRRPLLSAAALIAIALAWRRLAAYDLDALVSTEMTMGAPWQIPESAIRDLLAMQLPGYLAHFAVGIVAGHAWFKWRQQRPGRRQSAAWLLLGASALGLLYWVYARDGAGLGVPLWLATALLMGVVILAFVSSGVAAGRVLLGNRALTWVGRVSYSAYLYHLPLLLIWNRFGPDLGWLNLPAYLAALFAVSWVSYRCVELTFMSSRPAPSRPPPEPAPATRAGPADRPCETALRSSS